MTEPTALSKPDGFAHLGRLVGPASTVAFLADTFGRRPLRRRLDDGEAGRLFGWAQLNEVMAAHRLGPPRCKIEKAGQDLSRKVFRERRLRPNQVLHDLDVPALYEQLRDGATLIVDAVDELHPPLRVLCAGLRDEFCAHSQANLYACWGESQGFDVHWDDHDVFVVQVDGAKRWDLYGVTRDAPVRRDSLPAPAPTHPPERIVLEAGDMLYLPRGYWHAAVGLGAPSLHLTIGLSRKTGSDFLRWLADEQLALAQVRADLRLEQDDATLGRQIGALLASLVEADPAALGGRYRRHLEAAARRRPDLAFPNLGRAEDLGDATLLRLASGPAALDLGGDPQAVRFAHRGVHFTLAAETAPLLEALLAGSTIAVGDLAARCPGVSEIALRTFVSEMVRRAVFLIEPAAR